MAVEFHDFAQVGHHLVASAVVGNGQQAHVELLVDGEELGGVGLSRFARLGRFFQLFVQRLQFGQFGVGGLAR